MLIDRNGVIVASTTVPAGSTTNEVNFNISGVQNGLYFLHVSDGVEKAVRIIVKY
ncbi:hypothetical protein [Paraflavitalea speifideaquila]|uniref:hypothetical protein n=1 Tax=Paraflavitalea speifideaquila TaxID=3076558 RepID=UPI0028E41AB7|nr:hypothetical protein [Paraflavitalea speifideiaquila]